MLCVGWSTGYAVSRFTRVAVGSSGCSSFLKRRLVCDKPYQEIDVMGKSCSKATTIVDNMSGQGSDQEQFYDRVVCQDNDIQEGQFKEIKLDDEGKVSGLLIRQKGELSALSNKCTHYGANLATAGSLGDGIIRCPWHGACFNISSGDIEVQTYIKFPFIPCLFICSP